MHSISLPLSSEQYLLTAQLKNPPDLSKLSVHAPSYKEKGNQTTGQEKKQLEATEVYSEVCTQLQPLCACPVAISLHACLFYVHTCLKVLTQVGCSHSTRARDDARRVVTRLIAVGSDAALDNINVKLHRQTSK